MNVPRVDLYNGGFDLIGRLATASAVDRSYAIMEPGQLMFTIKRDDPLAHDTDPRQGRVVVVHSSAYPYPWVGYITNLEWNPAADTIRVTALSLDAILSERALPSDLVVSGAAGSCVARILDEANAVNQTGISRSGTLAIGPPRTLTVNDRTPFSALTMIARASAHEWWVSYALHGTHLVAELQFADAMGYAHCDVYRLSDPETCQWTEARLDMSASQFALTLVGGTNSATATYGERPRTRALASVDTKRGPDVVAAAQPVLGHSIEHSALDTTPMTRRERVEFAESLRAAGDVSDAAALMLMRPPRAERTVRIKALGSDEPGIWTNLALGNVIGLDIADDSLFFGGGLHVCVRLIGVQPKEHSGVCDLVVQIMGAHIRA